MSFWEGWVVGDGGKHLLRSKQSHPHNHPTALTRPQRKRLLDSQRVHHLQCHDCRIPIREVLASRARRAVSQWLDGEKVHGFRELGVGELAAVQRDGCAHRVDEHDCWF